MKTLITILLSFISCSFSFAQWTVDCSKLRVNNIVTDSFDSTKYRVSVFYSDTTNNHINYPYVSYIMSTSGDTLAIGTVDLFAHLGPSEIDYLVNKESSQPLPLNVYVHFAYATGNGDSTCILEYPFIGTSVNDGDKISPAIIYPNPAADVVSVSWKKTGTEIRYLISDASGKSFSTGWTKGRGDVDVSGLTPGIYFLKLTSGKEVSIHRILVENN